MRKLAIGLALASTALATPALARDGAWYIGGEFGGMLVEDASVEEVLGDRPPVDLALREGVYDRPQESEGDGRGHVPPRVPDRHGLVGLRSGGGRRAGTVRLAVVNSHGWSLSEPSRTKRFRNRR